MTKPQTGTIWIGSNFEPFTVLHVTEASDPWIHYVNKSKQEFNCRLEAFLERFKPEPK